MSKFVNNNMSLTSSPSLLGRANPYISHQLNPNTTAELGAKFNELGIPESFRLCLLEQFSDSLHVLTLLKHISRTPLDATNDPLDISSNYEIIDGVRLAKILCGIAGYDCGKKQLQQLVEELQPLSIKLKFIQPKTITLDQDEYALKSSASLTDSTLTLYISVQPDAPIPNPHGRAICKYNYLEDKVERMRLVETTGFTDTQFEGYKCGHELSHAIAFVKFYKSLSVQDRNQIKALWDGQHNSWTLLFERDRSLVNTDKMWDMFFKPEEYRNVLGLGLEKTFEDPNCIIGEFDYLNELMGKRVGVSSDIIYIRIPYDEEYWDEDVALELCQKKYHQLHPELSIKGKSDCIML